MFEHCLVLHTLKLGFYAKNTARISSIQAAFKQMSPVKKQQTSIAAALTDTAAFKHTIQQQTSIAAALVLQIAPITLRVGRQWADKRSLG